MADTTDDPGKKLSTEEMSAYSKEEIQKAFEKEGVPTLHTSFYLGLQAHIHELDPNPFSEPATSYEVLHGIATVFNARRKDIQDLSDVILMFDMHRNKVADVNDAKSFFGGLRFAMHSIHEKTLPLAKEYVHYANHVPSNMYDSNDFVYRVRAAYRTLKKENKL